MLTDNIHWLWKKSSKRKHIALHIDHGGVLEVRTPMRTSQKKVERLIIEKRAWIERSTKKQQGRIHPKFPDFVPHGELYFLGELYAFSVELSNKSSLKVEDETIFIKTKNERTFKKLLKDWYTQETQGLVESSLKQFADKLPKAYCNVDYRYYKRRWGSCDSKNNLMFNALLSLHKEEHIRYVVAHELAHIKEKNHSKAFYLEGERILSGFRNFHNDMRD